MTLNKRKSNTCIACIKNNHGKLMFAGDRRVSWENGQYQTMTKPKICKKNGLLLAGTGDCTLLTLILDILEIRDNSQDDIERYLHGTFYDSIVKLLKRKGFCDYPPVGSPTILKIPSDLSAEIIIGIKGKIFQLCISNPDPTNDHANGLVTIDELSLPYATGCGGQLAWGALKQTERLIKDKKLALSSRERLQYALKCAADVSNGCDDHIDIISED